LKGLGLARQGITPQFFGSRWIGLLTYFERIILSILLLLSMIYRPRGIVPEKNLRIPGINYSGIVLEKEKTRSPSASWSKQQPVAVMDWVSRLQQYPWDQSLESADKEAWEHRWRLPSRYVPAVFPWVVPWCWKEEEYDRKLFLQPSWKSLVDQCSE